MTEGALKNETVSSEEAYQLPQPDGECHPGVLGHSRRGGQPVSHTCYLVTL